MTSLTASVMKRWKLNKPHLYVSSIRNYRARYQKYTKTRHMSLDKYMRTRSKRGQEMPESVITDIDLANASHSNSEILSLFNSYNENKQNIPLISDRFFQQHFLSSFNKATTSSELRDILTNLKHKLSITKAIERINIETNLEIFENNILRLGYHSCIARCCFANNNGINNGEIDIDSILQFFNECKSYNLINHETYYLMLNGYINDYKQSENGSNDDKYNKIKSVFNEFEVFLNEIDPKRARNIISETPYIQGYIAKQNEKYSEIYSNYILFLCERDNKTDLIKAIEIFYNMIEQRYIIPNIQSQLLLMEMIGNESNDSAEIARIFRIITSYTVNSPSIDFYNKYLKILIKFGDIDECIKILRLLIFKKYWNYMSIPDAPLPNLQSFEYIFKCLQTAIQKNRLTQDVGARKAEFILKQMKELKIGTPHNVYVLLYEALGVAWWQSLPWHLRLINRP